MSKLRRKTYYKDATVDVEVEIEFEDVAGWLEDNDLKADERTELKKVLSGKLRMEGIEEGLSFDCRTAMDEIAGEKVQEFIDQHGIQEVVERLFKSA